MKKHPFQNKDLFKSFLLLLVLLSGIVINSCRKDIKQSTQTEIVLSNHKVDFTMLQNSYNKAVGNKLRKLNDINLEPLESIIGSLNVDWTTYSIFTYPDSSEVIEFSMPDDTTMFAPNMPPVHDSIEYHSKTSAVFILRKDTISSQFFMKTIEDATAIGYQSVINYFHYQQIPGTFTGNVLYFTFDRQFINGWVWNKGVLSKTLSFGATPSPPSQNNNLNKQKINNVEILPCEIDTYVVYSYQTASDGTVWNEQDIYTFQVATCDLPNDTGGGGDDSSPPGGATGGGVGATNPCSTSGPSAEMSIKGKHLDYTEPLPGGGGGTSPTNPPVPCPNPPAKTVTKQTNSLKIIFCDGLTSTEMTNIENTVMSFSTEDCASKYLYNYFNGKAFTFCITAGNYSDSFNPATNTFTFSTDAAATPDFAYLLEHEFFHAFQNSTYPGGINSYGSNSPGYVNIEFEQAVFNDIATGDNEAFANGTKDQQNSYSEWIQNLTSNGTVYPKLTPNTSAYKTFINKYNSFLQKFNAIPNNQYTSPVISLVPQALINLFNVVTPNC